MRVWAIMGATVNLNNESVSHSGHVTVSLRQSGGSSTFRRLWAQESEVFSSPQMHMYIKLSVKRIFVPNYLKYQLITSFTVSGTASLNFPEKSLWVTEKKKNRDQRCLWGSGMV